MREKTIRFRRAEPVERQGTAVLHFAHAGEDKWVSAGRARGDGRGRPSDVRQGTAVLLTGEDALSLPTCRTELFGDCGIESAFAVRSCGIFVL